MKTSINKTLFTLATTTALFGISFAGTPYISAGLGFGGLNTPTSNLSNDALLNGRRSDKVGGLAYQVSGGYLMPLGTSGRFQIGPELGYRGLAKNKYTFSQGAKDYSLNYKGYLVDAMAVGRFNITHGLFVQGKAGVAYQHQQIDTNAGYAAATGVNSTSKNSVKPIVSAGIGYNFKPVALSLDYTHVTGKQPKVNENASMSDITRSAPVNTLMFNVAYHFG